VCPYKVGVFNEALGIIICRPTGELTAELAHDLMICHECIVKAGLEQVNRFHDLTGITAINLKFHDLSRLCEIEAGFRKPQHTVKACYLVPNAWIYGTLRIYEALGESYGVGVHVSYDIGELADVLGIDPVQLSTEQPPPRDK